MSSNVSKEPVKPFRAALLSLLLGPGAGQIYNGQKKKGYLMLAVFLAVFAYMVYQLFLIYAVYFPRISKGDVSAAVEFMDAALAAGVGSNTGFIGFLWLVSIVDAYISAMMIKKRDSMSHNAENEIVAGETTSGADKKDA